MIRSDVVISATSAPGNIISLDQVAQVVTQRNTATLFLDLAVPRDIESGVAELDNCELLVLGDLQAFANRGLAQRQKEASKARAFVLEDLERYAEASSARQVAPLIGALHRRSEQLRADEINRHAKKLASLDPDQLEAVEALTKGLIAKMLHEPSIGLKKAAGSRRGDRLAEAARELFDL